MVLVLQDECLRPWAVDVTTFIHSPVLPRGSPPGPAVSQLLKVCLKPWDQSELGECPQFSGQSGRRVVVKREEKREGACRELSVLGVVLPHSVHTYYYCLFFSAVFDRKSDTLHTFFPHFYFFNNVQILKYCPVSYDHRMHERVNAEQCMFAQAHTSVFERKR